MAETLRVTVWNENRHERADPAVAAIYPEGIHGTIASFLAREPAWEIRTATLDEPEHGLTTAVLAATDVLVWWGHRAHAEVADEIVERVRTRVEEGMGLVVLHSGHYSKIFQRLMGTSCSLKWRVGADQERLWCVNRSHPITRGLPEHFEIPHEEMYGEPFSIPEPDELLFISWFTGGEVFRSGATWQRGQGRVFYFRPGHETFPTYHHEMVQTVITRGVKWAYSGVRIPEGCPRSEPLEPPAD